MSVPPPVSATPRLAPLSAACLAAVALSGCYASFQRGDGEPLDAGTLTPFDAGRYPDGAPVRIDAAFPGVDAASPVDAGRDAGPPARDAAVVGRDAEPAVGPRPNPASCRIEPEVFPFDGPVMEARWPEGGGMMSNPASLHVCATPLAVDLTPGGPDEEIEPVVVFVSYDSLGETEHGTLRIWDPRTGQTQSYPPATGPMGPYGPFEPSTNLAAADLDGDGDLEIVGMGVRDGTFAIHHDGTLMWFSPYPDILERGDRWSRTIGGAITLADLEGDGTVEVIAGRTVLEGATGAHRWTGGAGTTRGANGILGPISCVADLDGDGVQEIVAGRTALRADGSIFWTNTRASDGLCAIADMTPMAAGPEVVLVSNGYLYVINGRTGATIWDRRIEGAGREPLGGAPTVADFDGDGRPEIGVAHGSAYGVYDMDCTSRMPEIGCLGPGIRWTVATEDDSSAATGSSVFDFNGDGRAEVVYNDQYYFRILDGWGGMTLFEHANSSRTRTENPIIVDIDGDGDAEIIFSANSEASFLRPRLTDPGVEIWGDSRGRWVGARPIWNQHAYHITNVDDRGRVAGPETPSWTVLNAYRQNIREGGDVLVVPDLWGGRGTYECLGRGRARFAIEVQNWGLERVGAGVVVGFYRGRPSEGVRVGEARTTRPLLPEGGSEIVSFDVALMDPVVDYYAVLDDPLDPPEGAVFECREGNNQVLIWRPACR